MLYFDHVRADITLLSFFRKTKHHPDKPSGDVDTFRTLKRAQTVLSNPNLRKQYDILGLDLDDDEVQQNDSGGAENEDNAAQSQTASQTIVQDIASAALTAVLQFGVRTGTFCCAFVTLQQRREGRNCSCQFEFQLFVT